MKFASHLSAHITPEWRKQYVRYEELKSMLYLALEEAPSSEGTDEEVIKRYFATFDQHFFNECDKELQKINMFFTEKLAEATRKFTNLQSELALAKSRRTEDRLSSLRNRRQSVLILDKRQKVLAQHARKVSDLKLAFSEFYLSLILLQNYQSLNFTGFRKILKKHDKLFTTQRGEMYRKEHIETAEFYTNPSIDTLIQDTEQLYIYELEDGNRTKAMKRLRVPPLSEDQAPKTTFMVGFYTGMFLVLFIAICFTILMQAKSFDRLWKPYLVMYRGMFLVILMIFLLGVNTYGWRKYGVNHVLIFELDPREHVTHQELQEVAFLLGVFWCASVLLYLFSPHIPYLPDHLSPLILFLAMFGFLFNPVHALKYKARFWLLRILFRIITAPYYQVSFPDFWLADQLNSLASVLTDMEYLVCFYIFELNWLWEPNTALRCNSKTTVLPIVFALLPAWFRFAQCCRRYFSTRKTHPHLVNAGKYSTTFFTVGFSAAVSIYNEKMGSHSIPLLVLWCLSMLVSSCYTLTWDVKMDWGLLHPKAGENRFLREEIVYPHKTFYYFALVEDACLRFAWIFTYSCTIAGFMDNDILTTVLTCLEVFRRFMWNFFRLENEHLNNCGEFRAVRDISVAPLEEDHQTLLCNMMDNDDIVIRKKTPNYGSLTPKESKRLLRVQEDDEDDDDD